MDERNIIVAIIGDYYKAETAPSFLIDHGMQLQIIGVELPHVFEAHFSNSRKMDAKRQIGTDNVVTIPDEYFLSGAAQIYCWIYLHPTENSGVTKYEIVIPLRQRPGVDPSEPTPEQEDIIDQAIAALNAGVEAAEAAKAGAEGAQTAAETAQGKAENAQAAAETAQGKAEDAQDAAEVAAQQAVAAASTYPEIGDNDHWYTYDPETETYRDTGVPARGEVSKEELQAVETQFNDESGMLKDMVALCGSASTRRVDGGTEILNKLSAQKLAANCGFYYDTDEGRLYLYAIVGFMGIGTSYEYYALAAFDAADPVELTLETAGKMKFSSNAYIYKTRVTFNIGESFQSLDVRFCALAFDAEGAEISRVYSTQYRYTIAGNTMSRTLFVTAPRGSDEIAEIGLYKNNATVTELYCHYSTDPMLMLYPIVSTKQTASFRHIIPDSMYDNAQYGYSIAIRNGRLDTYSGQTVYKAKQPSYDDLADKPVETQQTVYQLPENPAQGMLFGQAIYRICDSFLDYDTLLGATLNGGAVILTNGGFGASGGGNFADLTVAMQGFGLNQTLLAYSPSSFAVSDPPYDFALLSIDAPLVMAEMYVNLPSAGVWALSGIQSIELPPITDVEESTANSYLPVPDRSIAPRQSKCVPQLSDKGIWGIGARPSLLGAGTYRDLQHLIKMGLANQVVPIGSVINVAAGRYGSIAFQVVAHDKDPDPDDANAHTVTFLALNAFGGYAFDEREALCICPSGMAAGTYNDGMGRSFVLTQDVPAGGVLTTGEYDNDWGIGYIRSWATLGSTTPIETVGAYNGDDGTNLTDALGAANVNDVDRARYGNGNWGQSAIRQFLNAEGGFHFVPENAFGRAPDYDGAPGLLGQLDPEFAAVLLATEQTTGTNTVYENGGYTPESTYVTTDKLFLPSHTQMGCHAEWSGEQEEGVVWDLYEDLDYTDTPLRVKYAADGPTRTTWWWLRSPHPWSTYSARVVGSGGGGASSLYAADRVGAFAPACVI